MISKQLEDVTLISGRRRFTRAELLSFLPAWPKTEFDAVIIFNAASTEYTEDELISPLHVAMTFHKLYIYHTGSYASSEALI